MAKPWTWLVAAAAAATMLITPTMQNVCPVDFGFPGWRLKRGPCVTVYNQTTQLAYSDYNAYCYNVDKTSYLHGFFSAARLFNESEYNSDMKQRTEPYELFHEQRLPEPDELFTIPLDIVLLNGFRITDFSSASEANLTSGTIELTDGNLQRHLISYKFYNNLMLEEASVKFVIVHPEQLHLMQGNYSEEICFVIGVRYVFNRYFYTNNYPVPCNSLKVSHFACEHPPFESCLQNTNSMTCMPGSVVFKIPELVCDPAQYYMGDDASQPCQDSYKAGAAERKKKKAKLVLLRRNMEIIVIKGKIFKAMENPGLIGGLAVGFLLVVFLFAFFTCRRRQKRNQKQNTSRDGAQSPLNAMTSMVEGARSVHCSTQQSTQIVKAPGVDESRCSKMNSTASSKKT